MLHFANVKFCPPNSIVSAPFPQAKSTPKSGTAFTTNRTRHSFVECDSWSRDCSKSSSSSGNRQFRPPYAIQNSREYICHWMSINLWPAVAFNAFLKARCAIVRPRKIGMDIWEKWIQKFLPNLIDTKNLAKIFFIIYYNADSDEIKLKWLSNSIHKYVAVDFVFLCLNQFWFRLINIMIDLIFCSL